jgi:GT2 family glycosyltransferase
LIINLLEYLYNKPELINKSLYFFEISLAAVLLPLADSPSQAIINFISKDLIDIIIVKFNRLFLDIPNNISLEIIKNKNLGNGAGINCGIENAKTKYVLYLDIDTILSDSFFTKLENAVNEVQEFAVIAPKINDFYNNKKIKNYGNLSISKFFYNKIFYKIKKETKLPENINHVFFVSGSIMLINKELIFDKNIKFDENIFMFFEEDDFFHQCFKLNLKIFLIDNIEATHLDGSVLDNTLNYECFKKWHWEWSKYYFLDKHYNKILISFLALKNLIKFYIKIFFYYFLDKKKLKHI